MMSLADLHPPEDNLAVSSEAIGIVFDFFKKQENRIQANVYRNVCVECGKNLIGIVMSYVDMNKISIGTIG